MSFLKSYKFLDRANQKKKNCDVTVNTILVVVTLIFKFYDVNGKPELEPVGFPIVTRSGCSCTIWPAGGASRATVAAAPGPPELLWEQPALIAQSQSAASVACEPCCTL